MSVLKRWATWSERLAQSKSPPAELSAGWTEAHPLIRAYIRLPAAKHNWADIRPLLQAFELAERVEARRFRFLFAQSKASFLPLSDPLDVEVNCHRQFSWFREEVYSDWLQWVLLHLAQPKLIAQVLGVQVWDCSGDVDIVREHQVQFGHQDHEGRLDLLIRDRSRYLAVVEVKTRGYLHSDLNKHEGYLKSIGGEPNYIFLAVDPPGPGIPMHGFQFRSWAEVCIELRKIAQKRLFSDQILATASILTMVAAVEQNLLNFEPASKHGGQHMKSRMAEHLDKALRREKTDGHP